MSTLSVIGAGAWGTTIAQLLAQNGHTVRLWLRSDADAQEMATSRENRKRLPGITLHDNIQPTSSLEAAVRGAGTAFVAVPSKYLADVLGRLPDVGALVSCVKGFGDSGLERISAVLRRHQPQAEVGAVSGPNLAREVAGGLPAAAVAAATHAPLALQVQQWLQSPTFRIYTSDDLPGVEIGGAIKNVIAVACGVSAGLGLGENTKAMIITRGLHEMTRLGMLLGGRRETFYGLSGLGDLAATCAGTESRNFTAGMMIARGEDLGEINAEGIRTVTLVHGFAKENGIDLPITAAVHAVASGTTRPADAIRELMERAAKPEALV